MDIAIFPKEIEISSHSDYREFIVIINTPKEVGSDFDLQLNSDKEIKLQVSGNNKVQPQYHSGKYLFLINNNFSHKIKSKYFKYEISIEALEHRQKTQIEILAQNPELYGKKSFVILP